jgi:signal peptidase I
MAKKKIKRKKNWLQDWFEAILFAFVVAMIIRNYTIQTFKIPSSSMEKTLLIGDYLIGNKLKYFFTDPKRNDIVTFYMPTDPIEPQPREKYARIIGPVYLDKQKFKLIWHQKKMIVKRVIGMPGDKIEVRDKVVYLNDKPYHIPQEYYIDSRDIPREDGTIVWNNKWYQNTFMGSRDNFGPVTVPDSLYFVMGDDRDVSYDSRYWGFLDRKSITGTPLIIYLSYGDPPLKSYNEFILKTRGYRPKPEFRWRRIFKLIK